MMMLFSQPRRLLSWSTLVSAAPLCDPLSLEKPAWRHSDIEIAMTTTGIGTSTTPMLLMWAKLCSGVASAEARACLRAIGLLFSMAYTSFSRAVSFWVGTVSTQMSAQVRAKSVPKLVARHLGLQTGSMRTTLCNKNT